MERKGTRKDGSYITLFSGSLPVELHLRPSSMLPPFIYLRVSQTISPLRGNFEKECVDQQKEVKEEREKTCSFVNPGLNLRHLGWV